MANLINKSFFVRDILIPNTNDTKVEEKVNKFIAKYEPEFLSNVLGYKLYKCIDNVEQRITDLKAGKEWTDVYGRLQLYKGLTHDTDISMIAYYTYYKIQDSDADQTTGVNTSIAKTEGAIQVSPADRMLSAWNKMSEEVQNLLSFLWINKDTYPEFDYYQYRFASNKFRKNSDFGF